MKTIYQFAGVTLGVLLVALGLNMFLIPNKIAAGGVSGIATILHYLIGTPVGLAILALDLPLFLMGIYRTSLPPDSWMTRFFMTLTMSQAWVTIITVVPRKLISISSFIRSLDVSGSRLPVGSSAIIKKRVVHDSPCNRNSLLFSAGKVVGENIRLICQTNHGEGQRHRSPDLLAGRADHLKGKSHIFKNGFLRQQAKVLEDHADSAAQIGNFLCPHPHQVFTVHNDLALCGHHLTVKQFCKRRLAGPAGANQKDKFTFMYPDGNIR
jgi:hypothetical protein